MEKIRSEYAIYFYLIRWFELEDLQESMEINYPALRLKWQLDREIRTSLEKRNN